MFHIEGGHKLRSFHAHGFSIQKALTEQGPFVLCGFASSSLLSKLRWFFTKKAGGSWDPFAPGAGAGPGTNGQQVQQQQAQMQQDDDWGLGELKDEDIWGTLPTKKDGVGDPFIEICLVRWGVGWIQFDFREM